MKKTILSLLLVSSSLLAEVTNFEVSPQFIKEKKIKIIDIRTQSEWEKMGIIKDAYLITFFPKNRVYNPNFFIKDLNKIVAKDEQFAIICNRSSRTKLVSNFLGKKHNYNVVNLIGGMKKLIADGYQVESYKPNRNRIALADNNITK